MKRVKLPSGQDLAYALQGILLIAAVRVFGILPVDAASALGGFMGRVIGPRTGVSRYALRNLALAMPENSLERNREILRGMWDNLGRTAAEYPHLRQISAPNSPRVEIVNGEIIAALAHDGRPGIVFGGHMCNWELGPIIIGQLLGLPLASIYRAPNNPWVDRLIRRLRPASVAFPKGGDGSRELMRVLKRGGHAAMLIDQKLNDGIAAPFFGHDAMTAPAIARLALRLNCPLVPITGERIKGAQFRVVVYPAIDTHATDDLPKDVLRIMTAANRMLEGWIRKNPEQWLWVHKRWPNSVYET